LERTSGCAVSLHFGGRLRFDVAPTVHTNVPSRLVPLGSVQVARGGTTVILDRRLRPLLAGATVLRNRRAASRSAKRCDVSRGQPTTGSEDTNALIQPAGHVAGQFIGFHIQIGPVRL
jgi:hypothetical protein